MNQLDEKRLANKLINHDSFMCESSFEIFERIAELRSQGKQIANMAFGELDFDTPEHIRTAAVRAIEKGQTRYTPVRGSDELIRAVQQKLIIENKIAYEKSEIMAGAGSKQLIFNAMMATLNERDEVIISAPFWSSYPKIVSLNNGTPVVIMTNNEEDYKITPVKLRAVLTSRTKWIILNSPGNPSGSVYTAQEFTEIAKVLSDYPDVLVLSDEIYEFLTYDATFISFASAVPHMKERTLTINGVSKSFAMTGWRIGYAAGPRWLINGMLKIQENSTSNPCSVSQSAATEALNGDKSFIKSWREELIIRRNCACDILARSPLLHFLKPQAALYIFINYQRVLKRPASDIISLSDDFAIVKHLIEYAGVVVLPGANFGMPGHVRLTFCMGYEDVIKACFAIVEAIKFHEVS
ncbi:pyridoxal phosphate-dependent aminotransferase [Enterobacter asburiae]|uniref:pyridoxal phosphate-dependent aminotransferase n=1 Tax=Enterobacter asburiae TaxID=61645 RepID=UPI0011D192B7|nr:pyridoxal phosphate-dependent aminotransferase [Enterobacter asburiae]